ncbi:hypothetical protein [Bartonella schoenbuchensis]|uniref:Right handed beta helix domain-containing protein n=1 Tax=Bartonella schoenbuchensis m07a TaxID=1094496 RepID=N6URD9_9HYPH|nr:hypothetical protein m07a_01830 [Bartonella schoenbuchensis m07a]
MVNISQVEKGAKVSKGTLEVIKGSIQGNTMGVEVSEKGVLKIEGSSTIMVTNGTGLSVKGSGKATMMGGSIGGSGGTGTGVEVNTSEGEVTLNTVEVSRFKTGASVKSGKLTVTGGSTIAGGEMGVGVEVSEKGVLKIEGSSTIMVQRGGTGLKVTGGSANMVGGGITGNGGTGTGVNVGGGNVTLSGGVKISKFATGVEVSGNGAFKMTGGGEITGNGNGAGVECIGGWRCDVGGRGDDFKCTNGGEYDGKWEVDNEGGVGKRVYKVWGVCGGKCDEC